MARRHGRTAGRARRGLVVSAAALAVAALLAACTSSGDGGPTSTFTIPPSASATGTEAGSAPASEAVGGSAAKQSEAADADGLPDAVRAAMQQPTFHHSSFGILVQDAASGETLVDLRSQEVFESGSTAKLFAAAAMLDTYGPDATFTTPIYRTGELAGGAVQGNLVLVASGDQNLGGRGVLDGPIQYEPIDHTYANGVGGATLTAGDPLAGIKKLAAEVKAAGVTGAQDVVVDDRLFTVENDWEQHPISAIVLNDNVIDVTSTPGQQGQPATLDWRPQVSGWSVRSEVTTAAAGSADGMAIIVDAPGQLVVKGSVAADAGPVVTTYTVPDPAAFARSALIDELTRAGVIISASPAGANPAAQLPARESYSPDTEVAALESAPLSETITMVLKTSHNPGADLLTCMLAVRSDSTSCPDGLADEYATAAIAGTGPGAIYLFDGAGTSPARFTPAAGVQLVDWMTDQSWGPVLKEALPNLGVSGDLALIKDSPAQGKIQAKTGTRAAPDPTGVKILVQTRTMVGYLEAASGRDLRFALMVQNMEAADLNGLFAVIGDVTDVATALQQSY